MACETVLPTAKPKELMLAPKYMRPLSGSISKHVTHTPRQSYQRNGLMYEPLPTQDFFPHETHVRRNVLFFKNIYCLYPDVH